MELKDEMKINDGEVKTGLRCAICNETVLPNQPHQCQKENKDETIDK